MTQDALGELLGMFQLLTNRAFTDIETSVSSTRKVTLSDNKTYNFGVVWDTAAPNQVDIRFLITRLPLLPTSFHRSNRNHWEIASVLPELEQFLLAVQFW